MSHVTPLNESWHTSERVVIRGHDISEYLELCVAMCVAVCFAMCVAVCVTACVAMCVAVCVTEYVA